jgi:hypothetical protein
MFRVVEPPYRPQIPQLAAGGVWFLGRQIARVVTRKRKGAPLTVL